MTVGLSAACQNVKISTKNDSYDLKPGCSLTLAGRCGTAAQPPSPPPTTDHFVRHHSSSSPYQDPSKHAQSLGLPRLPGPRPIPQGSARREGGKSTLDDIQWSTTPSPPPVDAWAQVTAPGRLQIEMGCSNQQLAGKHAPDSNRMEDWMDGCRWDGPDHRLVGVGDWNLSPPQIRALCVAYAVRQPQAHGMPRRRRPRPLGESGSSLGQQQAVAHLITSARRSAHGDHPRPWSAQSTAAKGLLMVHNRWRFRPCL